MSMPTYAPCDPPEMTIILAEDDREMRVLVAEALRRDGYRVLEVPDGARLVERISSRLLSEFPRDPVDLVISDVRMPGCTGLEFLSALRDADRETPVILMTAFGDAVTRAEAEALGALLFDKPFDIDDLRTAVLHVLR